MMRRTEGFTIIELVTIMVILGIIAVVAIPRMDTSAYHEASFHDRVVTALRFAQKSAASHRRIVCVTFPDNHTLTLNMDTNKDGVCDTALAIPGAQNNQVVSSDPANAVFTSLPAALSFATDGISAGGTISITGMSVITIYGATGYVQ
jgi:MSHA pilin protein MshC